LHLDNKDNEEITWVHAKTNTMKMFFNDRDEDFRDLKDAENDKKFKIFTDFINQMSNKNRQFDKSMKDLYFTHSLTTDIFNLTPNAEARPGEIVTGCMVVNKFNDKNWPDLKNDDAKVFSGLFSDRESIIFAGKNESHQKVTRRDCDDFIKSMKGRVKVVKNISAFVIHISSHGSFSQGGKQMCLSDEKLPITDLLNQIFDSFDDGECKKISEIPKIIFVDTCHGGARNHRDVNPRNQSKSTIYTGKQIDKIEKPSENTFDKKGQPPAGGFHQHQRTNIHRNFKNFIIFHASVQQNYSWQSKWGSTFLPVLEKTIADSDWNNGTNLDIMKLSFDLVKNIEKLKDEGVQNADGTYYRIKLMCETDVNLVENFSLRMKGPKIDSDDNIYQKQNPDS